MDYTFSLCIARFKESIEDVNDLIGLFHKLNPKVYIYNKDDISFINHEDLHYPDLTITIENIPNVGRDAQSFLYHIHKYQDVVTDINYFIPASYKTKLTYPETCASGCIFKTLENFHLLKSNVCPIWDQWYTWSINSWHGTHPDNVEATKTQTFVVSKIRPFGKWMTERVFKLLDNGPFLDPLKNGLCCFFQTTKERIQAIPKFILKLWLDELTADGPNSELVHYWERSWGTVFGSYNTNLALKNFNAYIPCNIDIYLKCIDYPVLHVNVCDPLLNVDHSITYFQIVNSLNNKEKCISFKYNDSYICVNKCSNNLVIRKYTNTEDFHDCASFRIYNGLCGSGYSFESYIKYNYYIRHLNYDLIISKCTNSDTYNNGCSFEIISKV